MKYLEKLKAEILNKALLSEFPDKENDSTALWVRAIALIRLRDGNYCYGLLARNPDFTYKIMSICGASAAIANVEEIYPYEILEKKYIKTFRGNDTKARIEYLTSLNLPYTQEEEYSKMTIDELNKRIVGAAIYLQTYKNK